MVPFLVSDTITLLSLTYFKNLCRSLFMPFFYLIPLDWSTVCDRYVLVLRIRIDRESHIICEVCMNWISLYSSLFCWKWLEIELKYSFIVLNKRWLLIILRIMFRIWYRRSHYNEKNILQTWNIFTYI